MTTTTKYIRDSVAFKHNPNFFLQAYTLDEYVDDKKEKLTGNLYIRIKRSANGKRLFKNYYAKLSPNKWQIIGSVDDISYRDAITQCIAMEEAFRNENNEFIFKNAFEAFLKVNDTLKIATIDKKRKLFNHAQVIHNTDIRLIRWQAIQDIVIELRERKVYTSMSQFFSLMRDFFAWAFANNMVEKDITWGQKLKYIKVYEKGQYAYIQGTDALKSLVEYIYSYPHQSNIRNALIFGLLSGLRSANIRNLHEKNIKIDENGEYYLAFAENETKLGKVEYLGLPQEIGKWLSQQNHNINGYIFESRKTHLAPTSEALSKALKGFQHENIKGDRAITTHSLRKALSTFCYENLNQNKLSEYEIETTLWHQQNKVAMSYNKSTNTETSRKVLTWWLGYINSIVDFNILGDKNE